MITQFIIAYPELPTRKRPARRRKVSRPWIPDMTSQRALEIVTMARKADFLQQIEARAQLIRTGEYAKLETINEQCCCWLLLAHAISPDGSIDAYLLPKLHDQFRKSMAKPNHAHLKTDGHMFMASVALYDLLGLPSHKWS